MSAVHQIQSSEQPPAQPSYVLRGHSAQIHAVQFCRDNTRLLTGDAEGFVVLWSTTTKRAVAVWKPHTTTILGLGTWESDKIITHGRDNKLNVWQLKQPEESTFSTTLPIDDPTTPRNSPWMLHTIPVNALNFCSFAMITAKHNKSILIATPGVQDGHVAITSLPSQDRTATIPGPKNENTGMLMAVNLHFDTSSGALLVITGYESGHTAVYRDSQLVYLSKPHSQPILSLALTAAQDSYFTSSADAIIAKHTLNDFSTPAKLIQTKHAGQQSLNIRSDDTIFATAGWDGRARVYSVKTMKEMAVLKWHKEGCYAVAFADIGGDASAGDGVVTVAQQRERTARTTHWLAAGSKDGKVSLWEIY